MICGIGVYALRVVVSSIGAIIERHRKLDEHGPDARISVSVIVPARNEEHNIEDCVRSVFACNYTRGDFQLIVVNDRSSDRTGAVLSQLQQEFPQLLVHDTTESEHEVPGLHGKARAVHQGVLVSGGELVLMTDADCRVAQGWIDGVVDYFAAKNIGLVASFTVIDARTPFTMLQALEWSLNHTLAMSGVGLKQPVGCFGNNLSIRRATYDDIGGYANIPFSVTEDLALMQAVERSSWGIRYACRSEMAVTTNPAANWGEFFRQHIRWANGGRALGWRATFFVLSSTALWLAFISSFFVDLWLAPLLVVGLRLAGDALVLLPSLRLLKRLRLAAALPLAVPFFMLLELVIPFLLLTRNVHWKGQVFRT